MRMLLKVPRMARSMWVGEDDVVGLLGREKQGR